MERTRYELYKRCPVPGVDRFLSFMANPVTDERLIHDTLKHAALGKPFNSYSTAFNLGLKARYLLEEDPRYSNYIEHIRIHEMGCQEIALRYKNAVLFSLKIRKMKGKWHSSIFSHNGYYDWIIADLEFNHLLDRNLLDRIHEIDVALTEKEIKAKIKDEHMYEMYKAIRSLFPSKDHYVLMIDIETIQKKSYEYAKRYKAETGD